MNDQQHSAHLIEVVPPAMRAIRAAMRDAAEGSLTMAQFRILVRLSKGPSSNHELADWQGVSKPAMSRMISSMISRGLVSGRPVPENRRQITLALTTKGKREFLEFQRAAQLELQQKIAKLTKKEKASLYNGLEILREMFK